MTVILVTGASGSIGRTTAVRLARDGHRVYAAARRQEPLDALASQNPGIQAVPLDVTDAGSGPAYDQRPAGRLGDPPGDVQAETRDRLMCNTCRASAGS